jgi:hypothetical protein
MSAKTQIPFIVAKEGIELAQGRVFTFITPSEAPVLEVDLMKLARLKGGPKAVDSTTVHIAIVLVPRTPNLVEIPEGKPSSSRRRLVGDEFREEVIFTVVSRRPIDRRYFEVPFIVAI